jgi:uncharacterized membrane protein
MRVLGLDHLLFAAGLAGLGVLSLFSGDFAFVWQPVPAWVPWRESLAHVSGVLLLAGGIGMLVKPTARTSALVMTIYMLSWVLLLQAPRAVQAPLNVGSWMGFAENSWLTCGGWILFVSLAGPGDRLSLKFAGGMRIARFLFAVSCLELGLSYFVYAEGTASMVPAWLPDRLGFAYLTGAGHFAAGVAILFAIFPRLAATMEAIMISLFVLLVHLPGVASEPASRLKWTMLFVATALAGSAWAIARSLRDASWGWARTPPEASSAVRAES